MKRWALWVLFAWGLALPARAWTDAHVRDARVALTLEPDGRLLVALDLGVEVRGGRLERLDLVGLEASLELDGELPGWFTTEDGRSGSPLVAAEGGGLRFVFPRGAMPRRGRHRVGVRYRVTGSAGDAGASGMRVLTWTLPGWETGLQSAQITWDLPAGAQAVETPDLLQTASRQERAGRTLLTFDRTELPRTIPWPSRVLVAAQALATPVASSAPVWGAEVASDEALGFAFAALYCWVLAHVGRKAFRGRAQKVGLRTRSLLGGTSRGVLLASGACAVLAGVVGVRAPWVSVAALLLLVVSCTEQVAALHWPPGLGHFEPIAASELEALQFEFLRERRGRAFWPDLGTWYGAATLALHGALVVLLSSHTHGAVWPLGLLCASLVWVSASRLRLPRSVATRAGELLAVAGQFRLAGCALGLVWFVPQAGDRTEPRLRVYVGNRHHGLLRLEVLTDARRGAAPLLLSVVAAERSAVDRALSAAPSEWERLRSLGGSRVAFTRPVADLNTDLSRLLATLESQTQRSADELMSEIKRAA